MASPSPVAMHHLLFTGKCRKIVEKTIWVRVMVFNTTFNNNSVISWQSVLLVEETEYQEKTTELSHVTDKLYITYNVVSSTPRHQ